MTRPDERFLEVSEITRVKSQSYRQDVLAIRA
jgi:hypothetical protein